MGRKRLQKPTEVQSHLRSLATTQFYGRAADTATSNDSLKRTVSERLDQNNSPETFRLRLIFWPTGVRVATDCRLRGKTLSNLRNSLGLNTRIDLPRLMARLETARPFKTNAEVQFFRSLGLVVTLQRGSSIRRIQYGLVWRVSCTTLERLRRENLLEEIVLGKVFATVGVSFVIFRLSFGVGFRRRGNRNRCRARR